MQISGTVRQDVTAVATGMQLMAPTKRRKKTMSKREQKNKASFNTLNTRQHYVRQLVRLRRERVLGALTECFVHSQAETLQATLIDKDHFDIMMPELTNQL